MRVYGLTGNIASGKSTVARLFAERGVPVVDADEVARAVVAPGTEGFAEVAARFPAALAPDGSLDRKALAALVFADEGERRALEAILHPRIALESARRMARRGAEGHPFGIYEATLLVENRLQEHLDGLIVVTAPEEVLLARAAARGGLGMEQARARLAAQLPQAAKAAAATWLIENDGTLEALTAAVERLHALLRARGDDR